MKNRVIIITIIILLVGVIGIKEIRTKENNILQEVKVQDHFPNKDKTLSIMIEQDGGEYKEDTNRTSWPDQETYQYEKAECTDGDGTEVPSEGIITFSENNIHVKTKNTIYCTLYFGIKPKGTPAEELILASNQLEPAGNVTSRGDTLRRYQGQVTTNEANITNDVPNYICFGTDDEGICTGDTDKYMYRIIGIDTSNNEIKIMKREALDTYQTWTSGSETWGNSSLQTSLNGTLYLNNVSKSWAGLIQPHNWGYGDVPNMSSSGFDSSTTSTQAYQKEQIAIKSGSNRGTLTNTKIGLIYASDYYLSGGDSLKCHYNSNTYAECKKSWMHLSNNDTKDLSTTHAAPPITNEWTMSRIDDSYPWAVNSVGYVHYRGVGDTFSVRPVFYLQSGLRLSGTGKLTDPFIIENVKE